MIGCWVRCVKDFPGSEIKAGAVYKVMAVHELIEGVYAFSLEGVAHSYASNCFTLVRPQGFELLNSLLNVRKPSKGSK